MIIDKYALNKFKIKISFKNSLFLSLELGAKPRTNYNLRLIFFAIKRSNKAKKGEKNISYDAAAD